MAAARLRALGVGEGEPVLLCAGNTPAIPVLYFAVHALGAVAVPIGPETPENVLVTLAADSEAQLAVVERAVSGMPCAVVSPADVTDRTTGHKEKIQPVCRSDAVADLLYTTGTTGRKKGVVLTQANILAAARNITAFVGNGPEDVEIVPLPLSHSFGLGRPAVLGCDRPYSGAGAGCRHGSTARETHYRYSRDGTGHGAGWVRYTASSDR